MRTPPERGPPWTAAGVAKLRAVVLEDALTRLARQRPPEHERADLMDWVCNEQLAPFSFLVCAASCGLDHERLREGLLALLQGGQRATGASLYGLTGPGGAVTTQPQPGIVPRGGRLPRRRL
ncbi:MAG: hypothetical protein WAT23_10160 [Chromatiaceae bacterium]